MKTYTCKKTVNAKPMTRGKYNELRGWVVPANENPADPGYLTVDDVNWSRDMPEFQGYVSWLPKEQFECFHVETGTDDSPASGLSFGAAIDALKSGLAVTRTGWNGKGMFLFLLQGSNALAKVHGFGFGEYPGEPTFRDAIFMRTVDNQLVPWTVSQSDALANDWKISDAK